MTSVIAVVDDEPDILDLVSLHLEKARYSVKTFEDAEDFRLYMDNEIPDLIILDLMLPDEDGLEVCKSLKKDSEYASIPVIMLTAKGEETDKIIGLELGADDYVTKPFSPKELVARVKAVLRRTEKHDESFERINIEGVLSIDTRKYEVSVKGEKKDLTTTEFKILKLLASKPGWVFSREQILDHLWGNEKIVIDRTVDVHVRNIRKKLGKAGDYIKNVRGVGYKFEE